MATISLCMIVKNEEEVLANCLNSVKQACDEIVIVDTGSTDKTKEIAATFTDKVVDFEWIDDFSAARNFAFSKATMDFILWLDADDVLLEEDLKKLLKLKKDLDHSVDVVSMFYNYAFDEFGNPTLSFRRNRLVKRIKDFKWHGVVHEYLAVGGNIKYSDIAVTHRKDEIEYGDGTKGRNLKIYEAKLERGEKFSPRDLYYFANELRDNRQYKKAVLRYNEFLATKRGWVEDKIMACTSLADCYSYLEDEDKAMDSLLKALKYDSPRPQTCCRLGDYFKNKKDMDTAVFWYQTAIDSKQKGHGGFTMPAYSTWYPHLQLCVCHWQLGNMNKAYEHNKLAEKYRPEDPNVRFNNSFFADFFREDSMPPKTSNSKKVLYIGWLGYKNLGDELMWNIFRDKFNHYFGTKNWELEATIGKPLEEYNLFSYDLIVLGGGSIICRDYMLALHRAIKKEIKVIIWGTGIDFINQNHISSLQDGKSINTDLYFSRDVQQKFGEVIDHAEFVGVRGPLTYEFIKQMGADENKLMISGDPGLLLQTVQREKTSIQEGPFKGHKVVGINWGTSFNHIYGGDEANVESQLVDASKELIKKGYKIYLYTVWHKDIKALKRLFDKINDPDNVMIDTKLYNHNEMVQLLTQFDFTINLKLHANITSLTAGTPFIALAYRFKVFDFTQSVDFDSFAIATDDNNLKNKILKLETVIRKDQDKIKAKMLQHKTSYTHRLNQPFDSELYL